MFKNYRIEARLVRNRRKETPVEEIKPSITPEDIERIANDVLKKVVIGATIIVAASVALSSAGQIAVNACNNHNKDED